MNKLSNIPIYWINLNRSSKRKQFFKEQINQYNIENHHRIEGMDGKNLDINDYKNKLENITVYELGCTLSHIKAINMASKNNDEYALILEDDCSFEYLKYQKFSILELINIMNKDYSKWNILQLCTTNKHNEPLAKSPDYIRKGYRNCTTAYLINQKGMDKMKYINKFNTADISIYKACNTYNTSKPYFTYNYSTTFKSTVCNQGENSKNTQYTREDKNKQFWDKYYNDNA